MRIPEVEDAPAIKREEYVIDSFRGIDLSNAPDQVDDRRSPDAPNMMPDLAGNPVKRTGYFVAARFPGRINGRYGLGGREVIHAGEALYLLEADKTDYTEADALRTGCADAKSTGQRVGDKLWIFDGAQALAVGEWDGEFGCQAVSDVARTPVIVISRNPTFGDLLPGGTPYEPVNLLSRKWSEWFTVTADAAQATLFQLSFGELDETPVEAAVMNAQGGWDAKTEGEDFTVDRDTGTVTFLEAPGATPMTGEDNVRITASRDWGEYPGRINSGTISVLFGESGTTERIFLSAGDNRDYYCAAGDPTMWGDIWYSEFGPRDVQVCGYSIVSGNLATHIQGASDGRSVFVRQGKTDEAGETIFPVSTVILGEEAIGRRTFVYMEQEPLFLTARGVYAITAADLTLERYTQNRSFYINKRLTAEEGLSEAEAGKWKNFYLLALHNRIYLLDTAQKFYSPQEPQSSYQFESYLWTGIPARVLWERDGALCFGDGDGRLCEFYTDFSNAESYNDDGEAIEAVWTLPDFSGKRFYKNKTIRWVAVKLSPFHLTSAVIEKRQKGIWSELRRENARLGYFDWRYFTWENFTWSNDRTARTLGSKIKIKKVATTAFRVANRELNEPFGLFAFALEYTESGRYKG